MPLVQEAGRLLAGAPFVQGGWQRAIEAVATSTRSSAAQMLGFGGPLFLPLNLRAGSFPGGEKHFDDPALHGPSNWRIGVTGDAMAIQHEGHYRAFRSAHATADYDDAVSDLDIPFGCQSALIITPRALLGLALLRQQADGPCDAEVLASFAWLRRQAHRAVMAQFALDNEAADLMLGGVERLSGLTYLLDRYGAVRAMTVPAERLLGARGPVRKEGPVLRLTNAAEDDAFQAALGRLLASDELDAPALHVTGVGRGRDGLPAWRLVAQRLPANVDRLGFDVHLAVSLARWHPNLAN